MRRSACLLAALLPLVPLPAAAAVTVKLATLAPDGSIWDQAVDEMAAQWRTATDGRVELRIYPGGVAGDEPDVLRKMRIGQLHAAVLTTGGLAEIDDAFELFNLPMFFDSYEELFFVLDRLTPELSRRLESKGYVFLGWGHAGWVHLFSTQPIDEVADLKQSKFFVSAGQNRMVQWWKERGYRPVPLATTDILTGLETGMIDALPSPPLAALMLQWYRRAPHMLDLGFAPLVGGTVVQKKVWERISATDRERLEDAAEALEKRLEKEVPRQDREAIQAMEKRGLEVTRIEGSPKAAGWRAVAKEFAESVKSDLVPKEILDQALAARAAYRGTPGASGARP